MKTIFEGTVNGIKYNTVQEYNKALTDAIAAGQLTQASSSTRCIPDEEPAKPVKTTAVFPFFDLDNFTGDLHRDDVLAYDFIERELSDGAAKVIIDSAKNESAADRAQLVRDYEDKIKYFEDARKSTILAYDEKFKESQHLQQLVDQNSKEIDILCISQDMLDSEIEFYHKVVEGLKDQPQANTQDEVLADDEREKRAHLHNLIDEIFGL